VSTLKVEPARPTGKVSSKGAVVIPRDIRERNGIRPGDRVRVVDYDGIIAVFPVVEDPIKHARGLFAGGSSLTEALLKERRAEREREEQRLGRTVTEVGA
jgi:AbrB family looped-hinge helix DNA binding protein